MFFKPLNLSQVKRLSIAFTIIMSFGLSLSASDSSNLLQNAIPENAEPTPESFANSWLIYDRYSKPVDINNIPSACQPCFATVNSNLQVSFNNTSYTTGDPELTGLKNGNNVVLLPFPYDGAYYPGDGDYAYAGFHYVLPVSVPVEGEYTFEFTAEKLFEYKYDKIKPDFNNIAVTYGPSADFCNISIVKDPETGNNTLVTKTTSGVSMPNVWFSTPMYNADETKSRKFSAKIQLDKNVKYFSFYGPCALCLLSDIKLYTEISVSCLSVNDDANIVVKYYDLQGRELLVNSLSELPRGIYVVREGNKAKKIIK